MNTQNNSMNNEIIKKRIKIKKPTIGRSFRLIDFHICDSKLIKDSSSEEDSDASEDDNYKLTKEETNFVIQMFGINEKGESCSIFIQDFQPLFYVKVGDKWSQNHADNLLEEICLNTKIKPIKKSIISAKLVEYNKLYGFTGGKKSKFVKLTFKTVSALNRVKNLWYIYTENGSKLSPFKSQGVTLELYESKIPPLLRYFHINNVSPSGWVFIPTQKVSIPLEKTTTCTYEFVCNVSDLIPQPAKETRVPYKIASFDIEASSSHGDFPLPIKTYKRLVTNMVDVYLKQMGVLKTGNTIDPSKSKALIEKIIKAAFKYGKCNDVDLVYPKNPPSKPTVDSLIKNFLEHSIEDVETDEDNSKLFTIESIFEKLKEEQIETPGGDDDNEPYDGETPIYSKSKTPKKIVVDKKTRVEDILKNDTMERDEKIQKINKFMTDMFPSLEGDKVTFIGTTFMRYGEPLPYLNHCLVLNTCDEVPGSIIETTNTEQELLTKWTELIQQENPDIIIGYNIFGFDYEFMFRRALENKCEEQFLMLSRKIGDLCANKNKETRDFSKENKKNKENKENKEKHDLSIENTKIVLATGEYDLRFPKMAGRLQIDMYMYFRRDFNLSSYKLDDVAGNFISDDIKKIEFVEDITLGKITELYTKNINGLNVGDYIHIEISSFTSDYYKDGFKFPVLNIIRDREIIETVKGTEMTNKYNIICIGGHEQIDRSKSIKWCMAKDDVSPQDIFRLSNGSSTDRAKVAKYCIQDCNLVHHLMNKIDVITGYVEMSRICSVPISFLVFRGQGIKLTSYVAKKCREKDTLMPDLEKSYEADGYEGAIVLPPKCSMYMDNPVACVDYSSLYPSSMISQNYSHDSKVWTKEYDLEDNLFHETGEKDKSGNYIYDNMDGYKYIDIEFDTFEYKRNDQRPAAKAVKTKVGKKVCRWAQLPNHQKSIMPAILEELLKARSDTRKLIKTEPDPFMQNILDKRQLGYKVTANSLYGQCGAKTSTFYEKDVAASTTATGRMMIIYAKRIIEEVYGDREYETESHGVVKCLAEYVYGDSVANYTPVYVRVNNIIDICTIENLAIQYGENKWVMCKEEGKQDKEFCELYGVESWSESGWTILYRVIRHNLASHKKMIRILTHTGLVDVTDDHSLLTSNGESISPNDVSLGTPLLHHKIENIINENNTLTPDEAKIMGFFFGNGSWGELYSISIEKIWIITNASMDLIKKYRQLCEKVYPQFEWCMRDPCIVKFRRKYIFPRNNENNYEEIVCFVKEFRKKMYNNDNKIIPTEVLSGNNEIRMAFWEGMCDAYGDKTQFTVEIEQTNQISASHIFNLASSIGWNVSINSRTYKEIPIYNITLTKLTQQPDQINIKKIEIIPYEGYVYDLTTGNHHFAAGIGNMIVHNTDSVFFTFNLQDPMSGEKIRGKKALEITIEIAQDAAKLCTQFLKPPMELSYEKTLMPFILLSKKRYVGMLYEEDPNKGKMKYMGLSLKRRDSCDYLKDTYGGILNILMKENNIQNAIEFLDKSLIELIAGNVPMDKLTITKALRGYYKNPGQIAHNVLAERITKRDPGNKPKPGDRMKFVHIVIDNKKALQGEKIETPEFIIHNNTQIDYTFYITNQLMKPLQQLFGLALEQIWEYQNKGTTIKTYKKEIAQIERECENLEVFMKKKEKYCSAKIKNLLFDKYLTQIYNEQNKIQTITSFFKKK